jgi:hypothetical protein
MLRFVMAFPFVGSGYLIVSRALKKPISPSQLAYTRIFVEIVSVGPTNGVTTENTNIPFPAPIGTIGSASLIIVVGRGWSDCMPTDNFTTFDGFTLMMVL